MSYEKVQHLLNDYISNDDLNQYTNRFNAAIRAGNCPASIRFEYALALTRSRYKADHLRAVNLLEDLSVSGDPEAFRDYLYYLTTVNIKLQVCFGFFFVEFIIKIWVKITRITNMLENASLNFSAWSQRIDKPWT